MLHSFMRAACFFALASSSCLSLARADPLPTKEDARLIPVIKADRVWNGVATTQDGRIFVVYPNADGPGVKIEEFSAGGKHWAYPDTAWNAWREPGNDIKDAFVQVNALRIGPDGALWVIDAGAPGLGKPAVPGAARIFRFDLAANKLARVYDLSSVAKPMTYVDDLRFNGKTAYLTDAGAPGLIVLDLESGKARRVLDDHPSTIDRKPMKADGKILRDADGKELLVHADQIEISPDGDYVYYQPSSGPLSRIGTKWLDDENLSPEGLASHVEQAFVDTPTTGGTAIDANGTIYLSDTDNRRILALGADGKVSTLIADPRLIWSDAMWIDDDGFLWIPASQQNLTPGFAGGKQEVKYPVWIYKMQIHQKPARNDHP